MHELLKQRQIRSLLSKYSLNLLYVQTLLKELEGSSSKSTQSFSKAYDIECSAPDIFHGNYLTSIPREQLRNCCDGLDKMFNDALSSVPQTSASFNGSSLDVSKAPFIYNNLLPECFEVMAATTPPTVLSTTTKTTTVVMTSPINNHVNETTMNLLRHNDEIWLTVVLIFLIALSIFLTIIILYRCRSLLQEPKKNKSAKEDKLIADKAEKNCV